MITASIVSYHHRPAEMHKVIDCVLASPVSILFIVDNSLNDSLRELSSLSGKIRYIHSVNLGYGAGHNIAIREAIDMGAGYHVVINPDIYFNESVMPELQVYMENHKEVGLVMPKILYPSGEVQHLCKLLPTPADLFMRRFLPLKNYVAEKNKRYELRFTDYNTTMEVPSLSGCFMFMRISVLQKVGGFDERYFMYAEDLDLCRRILKVAKNVYYPKVEVYHEYAKGSYHNKMLLKYHIKSLIKYFNKWGWFFDRERKYMNQKLLSEWKYKNR